MMRQETARNILRLCHVVDRPDFHSLDSSTVDSILRHADEWRYRKPRLANGSRARYFYAYLLRRAFPVWKTEYQLWIDYGQGWEHEISEDSRSEIRERLREYRDNCPQYPVKWKTARVRCD